MTISGNPPGYMIWKTRRLFHRKNAQWISAYRAGRLWNRHLYWGNNSRMSHSHCTDTKKIPQTQNIVRKNYSYWRRANTRKKHQWLMIAGLLWKPKVFWMASIHHDVLASHQDMNASWIVQWQLFLSHHEPIAEPYRCMTYLIYDTTIQVEYRLSHGYLFLISHITVFPYTRILYISVLVCIQISSH